VAAYAQRFFSLLKLACTVLVLAALPSSALSVR
jgi:hypothetical protein